MIKPGFVIKITEVSGNYAYGFPLNLVCERGEYKELYNTPAKATDVGIYLIDGLKTKLRKIDVTCVQSGVKCFVLRLNEMNDVIFTYQVPTKSDCPDTVYRPMTVDEFQKSVRYRLSVEER